MVVLSGFSIFWELSRTLFRTKASKASYGPRACDVVLSFFATSAFGRVSRICASLHLYIISLDFFSTTLTCTCKVFWVLHLSYSAHDCKWSLLEILIAGIEKEITLKLRHSDVAFHGLQSHCKHPRAVHETAEWFLGAAEISRGRWK